MSLDYSSYAAQVPVQQFLPSQLQFGLLSAESLVKIGRGAIRAHGQNQNHIVIALPSLQSPSSKTSSFYSLVRGSRGNCVLFEAFLQREASRTEFPNPTASLSRPRAVQKSSID